MDARTMGSDQATPREVSKEKNLLVCRFTRLFDSQDSVWKKVVLVPLQAVLERNFAGLSTGILVWISAG